MKNCLILEDQKISREIFDEHAKHLGLRTIVTSNVEDAIRACKEQMPHCIILDWHMPDLDGIDFLKFLKEMPGGHEPIIIMCTCDDLIGQKQSMKELGVKGYLSKPIRLEELKNELYRLNII